LAIDKSRQGFGQKVNRFSFHAVSLGSLKTLSPMNTKLRIGVLLSGCGVYDGSEIPESVLVLSALDKRVAEAVCLAPDVAQPQMVNHPTGEQRRPKLAVGTTEAPSPYDIRATRAALNLAGTGAVMTAPTDVLVDDINNSISSPCYMMESSVSQVADGIEKTISKLLEMVTLVKEG